jgi:hypothetical protein
VGLICHPLLHLMAHGRTWPSSSVASRTEGEPLGRGTVGVEEGRCCVRLGRCCRALAMLGWLGRSGSRVREATLGRDGRVGEGWCGSSAAVSGR